MPRKVKVPRAPAKKKASAKKKLREWPCSKTGIMLLENMQAAQQATMAATLKMVALECGVPDKEGVNVNLENGVWLEQPKAS